MNASVSVSAYARPKCGAHGKQSGQPCKKPAGWGTDHVGEGRCRVHGGNTPSGRKNGARLLAEKAVVTLGLPRNVDAHTALIEEVRRSAGHVAWYGAIVAQINQDDLTWIVAEHKQVGAAQWTGDDITWVGEPSVWLKLYNDERKHLVHVCATAIKAGVEERRVRIEESQAALVGQLLHNVFGRLDLTPEQAATALVAVPEEIKKLESAA